MRTLAAFPIAGTSQEVRLYEGMHPWEAKFPGRIGDSTDECTGLHLIQDPLKLPAENKKHSVRKLAASTLLSENT